MSKGKTDNAIKRQWDLLRLLPTRGAGITASDLTRLYSESQGNCFDNTDKTSAAQLRKIQRDLSSLEESDLVVCNDKSKPFGWILNEKLAYFARLSDSEALFLSLSEKTITPLLPPSVITPLKPVFERAKEIVKSHNRIKPPLNQRIVHVPVQPLIPPRLSDEILKSVHTALSENKILMIRYQAAYRTKPLEMNVHIWGLFQNAPSTYMIATVDGTQKPKFFALHRINSARVTTLSAEIPKDFDIKDMLNSGELQFGSEGPIKLELLITPITATILEQTPLAKDQVLSDQRTDDDRIMLTATVNHTWELQFWLLSKGSDIEVLKPRKLRNSIAKELNKAADWYR